MSASKSRAAQLALISAMLVVAALLFAACGDGEGDEDDSTSTSAEERADEGEGGDAEDGDAEGGGDDEVPSEDEVAARNEMYDEPPTNKLDPKRAYVVRVTTSMGEFDINVDQKAGPIAAANFVFLVEEGFYDGVVFHRIIKDFMIQTGDPTGTGMGGPGYALKDDPVNKPYTKGTVAMANAGPDTGGSQFFIVHGPQGEALPPDYVIFGQVDEAGMDVVDKIASVEVETGESGEPSSPVETVRIERAELLPA